MPNENSGFVSDLAGVPCFFIDPEGAAKRVHSKWFWVIALVIASIIAVAVSYVTTPIALHAASVSPPPNGITTEQMVSRTAIGLKIVRYATPVLAVIFWLLEAAIMLGVAAVMGVQARFGALFNLVAGCGLIRSLEQIAAALILHFKGEVSSMAELRPAMGLDIFMPEGTNKFLVAFGSTISVFQIWWIVMLALVFASAFRVSKGKGFAAAVPLWLIGLLFSLVGAVFQQ